MTSNTSKSIERHLQGRSDERYTSMPYDPSGLAVLEQTYEQFPFKQCVVYRYYPPNHLQRYMLLADQFRKFLIGDILDVGARDRTLEEIVGRPVAIVDKNNPDVLPFDWEREKLPYPDGSFDAVICLDTLEHVNDIHTSLDDLFRVAKSYVLVSLPNCWRKALKEFVLGRGGTLAYGLPLEKPKDRHKWFFHTEDIEQFLSYRAFVAHPRWAPVSIRYYVPKTRWWHYVLYPLGRVLLPMRYFKLFFVHTVFIVLGKSLLG